MVIISSWLRFFLHVCTGAEFDWHASLASMASDLDDLLSLVAAGDEPLQEVQHHVDVAVVVAELADDQLMELEELQELAVVVHGPAFERRPVDLMKHARLCKERKSHREKLQ